MKKLNYFFTALLGLIIVSGFYACDKDKDNQYQMANQDFVNKASSANMFEIAAGQLAIDKGQNASVKAYGQHMVTDHGATATEMKSLAQKKNWTIPASMLPEQQDMYNMLNSQSGAAFDKQFAAMMVTSHQQTIALFEQAASDKGVPDADLRGFANGKLPALREHLKDAQSLQTTVNQ